MKRRLLTFAAILVLVMTPTKGQEFSLTEDFLTEFEADLIRLAQEPSARIPQYLHFAKLRLALIDQLLKKDEPGRGARVHKNVTELSRIVEAVDMVVDDALLRDADLSKTIPTMLNTEKELLSRLEEIRDMAPDDLWRFEFALDDAIDVLSDSIEITSEDLGTRKSGLIEADGAEKAAREKMMSPTRRQEVKEAAKEEEKEEAQRETKRPSLLDTGEKTFPEQQREEQLRREQRKQDRENKE